MSREIAALREGQRVRFTSDWVRARIRVPAGSTATVDYVDDHLLTVTLDEPIEELRDADNQVDFPKEEFRAAANILQVLDEPD